MLSYVFQYARNIEKLHPFIPLSHLANNNVPMFSIRSFYKSCKAIYFSFSFFARHHIITAIKKRPAFRTPSLISFYPPSPIETTSTVIITMLIKMDSEAVKLDSPSLLPACPVNTGLSVVTGAKHSSTNTRRISKLNGIT